MNRSFLYGDGFFETMRIEGGKIQFLAYHLARAKETADFLRMNWPKHWIIEFFEEMLLPYVDENQIVRITFYRDGGGAYVPNSNEICLHIQKRAIPSSGFWLDEPISSKSFLNKVKTLNPYLVEIYTEDKKPITRYSKYKTTSSIFYVKAGLRLKESQVDDLILLNQLDRVCEGLSSSLLVYLDGTWLSPKTEEGPIEGTYLSFLSTFLPIKREPLTIDNLKKASVILLVNAAQGIRKVKLI